MKKFIGLFLLLSFGIYVASIGLFGLMIAMSAFDSIFVRYLLGTVYAIGSLVATIMLIITFNKKN